MKIKKDLGPIIAAGLVVGVIAVILIVVSVVGLLRRNPYGDETVIDDFGQYYAGVPQDEKDLIFYQLHTVLTENVEGEVPGSGAVVREGTADYDYDGNTQVYYGKFVVDVPVVEQSYQVQFEWSPVRTNQNMGGYPVLITCVPASLKIYEGGCVDMAAKTVTWRNEYQIDYSYGEKTSYRIREVLREYMVEKIEADEYLAVVDETSVERLKAEPAVTYGFKVGVNGSDSINSGDDTNGIDSIDGIDGGGVAAGRVLRVVARTDALYGEEFIAVYVEDLGSGSKMGYVLTSDAGLQGELGQWMLGVAGMDEMKIKYNKL